MDISKLQETITEFTKRVVGLSAPIASRHSAKDMRVPHKALPKEWRDSPGIYAFHTNNEVVYVGRAARDSLGMRVQDQVRNRGDAVWNTIVEGGSVDVFAFSQNDWIWVPSLEVSLIEAGAPIHNRRRC